MKHLKIASQGLVFGLIALGMLYIWQELGGTLSWYVVGIAGVVSSLLFKFAYK